jgi:hypothetical protein
MKKNLYVLLFSLVAVWRFSGLLSMETEKTPLTESDQQKAAFTNAVKNGDVKFIKWFLQKNFSPDFFIENSTRTPLGLACECLNDSIRNFNMHSKTSEDTSHGCYCLGCLKQPALDPAQNIEIFKEIIFLLAGHIKPKYSDQISIEITLGWLTGPHEDKELSCLLERLLPPKDRGYQT